MTEKDSRKIDKALRVAEVFTQGLTSARRERILYAAKVMRDLHATLAKFDAEFAKLD